MPRNPLFPDVEAVLEVRVEQETRAASRTGSVLTSLNHSFSAAEVREDTGRKWEDTLFFEQFYHLVAANFLQGESPFSRTLTPHEEEIFSTMFRQVYAVVPLVIERPSGLSSAGGYPVLRSLYYFEPEHYAQFRGGLECLTDFGTIFLMDAIGLLYDGDFDGRSDNPLAQLAVYDIQDRHDAFDLLKFGNNSPHWFSVYALLAFSPAVVCDGEIQFNPFYERRRLKPVRESQLPEYYLTKRCAPLRHFVESASRENRNLRINKLAGAIIQAIPEIKAHRRGKAGQEAPKDQRSPRDQSKQPSEGYYLRIGEDRVLIPDELPLPPATFDEYVKDAVGFMPDAAQSLARRIVEGIHPVPAKDVFRIRRKIQRKFVSLYQEHHPDAVLELPPPLVLESFVVEDYRRKLLEKNDTAIRDIHNFEMSIYQTAVEGVYPFYNAFLQVFENAFEIWKKVEEKKVKKVSTIRAVGEGRIELGYTCERDETPEIGALDEKTPLLRYCDPAFYRENVEELASMGSQQALTLLNGHRRRVRSLQDEDLDQYLGGVLERCQEQLQENKAALTRRIETAGSDLERTSLELQLRYLEEVEIRPERYATQCDPM